MIDSAIFIVVVCLVPWLCYKGAKRDDEEREEPKTQTKHKKLK